MPDDPKGLQKHLAEDKQEAVNPQEISSPKPKATKKQPSDRLILHSLESASYIKIIFADGDPWFIASEALGKAQALAHILCYNPPEDSDDANGVMRIMIDQLGIIDAAVSEMHCRLVKTHCDN